MAWLFPDLIMPRLDRGILFVAAKKDGRVKPGHDGGEMQETGVVGAHHTSFTTPTTTR